MPTTVKVAAVKTTTMKAALKAAEAAHAAKMIEVRRVPKFMVLPGMMGHENRIAVPIATPVRLIGIAVAISKRRTASDGTEGEQTGEENR